MNLQLERLLLNDIEAYERKIAEAKADLLIVRGEDGADEKPLSVHLDEALMERSDDDASDWLIEGLIGKQAIGMLAGAPQVGKSTLAVQLLVCLANGRDVLNRRVFARKTVLYLLAEGSREQFLQRVGVAAHALNLSKPSGPWFMQRGDADVFDISKPPFETIIRQRNPDLVVLDTVYKFSPGTNENHADEWRSKVYGPLFRLSVKYGCTFLLLHHENKGNDSKGTPNSVAGTYAQYGDTDIFMRLRDDDDGGNMTLHLDKVRGRPKMTIPLWFDQQKALFHAGRSQRQVVADTSLRDPILAIIEAGRHAFDEGYVGRDHILSRLNASGGTVVKATLDETLSTLVRDSVLERKHTSYRVPAAQKGLGL